MENYIVFGILSIPVILVSRRTLFDFRSHGFYRLFSWECIIWLLVSNYTFWFVNPFGIRQVISWIFLVISLYLLIAGVWLLRKTGKPKDTRNEKSLFRFEKTSELVDRGIFSYIRHPLYSSLLFLTWGIFLKNTSVVVFIVALLSSIFLYITALFDEKECIAFFGPKYAEYKKRSKMFIPFII